MFGVVAIPIVWAFFGFEFALVIGSTLFVICTWASFAGGLLPIVAKRIGIRSTAASEPATSP